MSLLKFEYVSFNFRFVFLQSIKISISCEISMQMEKFKDSLIRLRIILEEIEFTERSKARKVLKIIDELEEL